MKNKLKEKLLNNEAAFGVSVMIPSPQIVEMIGGIGFDWILIDCEHGTINLETVELMVMAAETSGITPIVRPCSNTPEEIMKVLDRGAAGVQVPHVKTPEEAQKAVEAVKFYPMGRRSLAKGTRAAGYGFNLSMNEYVKETNKQSLVCVQLEDKEAIENAEKILQVENIDVFFIGPSDLSQSLGYPGQKDDPKIRKVIKDTFRLINSYNKIPGCAGNAEDILEYRKSGVKYLYTHLTSLLKSAGKDFFTKQNK